MRPALSSARPFLLLIAGLALTACSSASSPGGSNDLVVNWKVKGLTCSDVGLQSVRVEIYDGDGQLWDSTVALCANGRATFKDVPAGTWRVRALGLDAGNKATHEATAEVEVESGDAPVELSPPLELELRRAVVVLSWAFPGGEPCNFAGVRELDITAWDLDQQQLASVRIPCDVDLSTLDPLPDGSRPSGYPIRGLPPRQVRLNLFGLDAEGVSRYEGSTGLLPLEPGEVRKVRVSMQACAAGKTCR